MDHGPEVLESRPRRELPRGVSRVLTALVLVTVVGAGTAYVVGHRPEPTPRCGVHGHPEWCRTPTADLTDPSLVKVLRTYCPGLDAATGGRPVPQPVRLQNLAEGPTFAIDTGRPGTEDVLLGTRRVFAKVTLWRGGRYDGRVDVRCPGGTAQVPVLELTRDQVASTRAALSDVTHRTIDFAGLAADSVQRTDPDRSVSSGTFSCDTTRVRLRSLRPGQRFGCQVEVFRLMGKGVYPLTYEVTRATPFARLVTPSG